MSGIVTRKRLGEFQWLEFVLKFVSKGVSSACIFQMHWHTSQGLLQFERIDTSGSIGLMFMFDKRRTGYYCSMSMAITRTLLWGGFYSVGSATSSVANRGSVKPGDRIWRTASVYISTSGLLGTIKYITRCCLYTSNCTSYTGTKTHGHLGIS